MEDLFESLERLEDKLKILKKKVKIGVEFTQKFLNKCGKAGYTRISIGKRSNKVSSSKGWTFGTSSSVFGFPSGIKDKTGWCAIWGIVEELGISGGCGNADQHQVSEDNLIEGVFQLKGKKWMRIE